MTAPLISSISIHTNIGLGWAILVSLFLLGFTAWTYRWTRPPVSSWLKIILVVLRGIALLSVWLLVTDFEIRWENIVPRQDKIALLVDNSSSMSFQDSETNREETVKAILSDPTWEVLEDRSEIESYTFSDQLKAWNFRNSDYNAGGIFTDISGAINSLLHNPGNLPDQMVLVSDGAFNKGDSPSRSVRKLGIPVYTIAVGDSIPPKDVVITSIAGSSLTYAGEKTSLDVMVRGTWKNGESSIVYLKDNNGTVINSDTVFFKSDWSESTVQFDYTPGQAGLTSLLIEAETGADEINRENNLRRFPVRAAERRRKIVLLAGGMLQDAGFLARMLESDDDTSALIVIGGGPGGKLIRGVIPSKEEFDAIDGAIVLLGTPLKSNLRQFLDNLVNEEIPLVILTGKNVDGRSLKLVENRLGGVAASSSVDEAFLVPAKNHPIFTIDGGWFENSQSNPPPVDLPPLVPNSGIELAVADDQSTRRPVIVASKNSPRTLGIFAEGMWRWDLARRPIDPGGSDFAALWSRILRWLTSEETSDRISVNPSKDLFTGGEEIELVALVRDESLRPVDDANVSAIIKHNGKEQTVVFSSLGDGRYIAYSPAWGEGEYHSSTTIKTTSETLKRENDFLVDAFNLEDTELRMRPDQLRAVANASGGAFLEPDQVKELLNLTPESKGTEIVSGAWRPFSKWIALLSIVALLAMEWIIRTRKGML